ncbi:MAG: hypothetical protein V3T48_03095, partial [Vicinamibacterales bacterium]
MKQQGRAVVISQAVIDGIIGVSMFVAAYLLRFETILPMPKGQAPIGPYLQLAPFIGLLLPFGLWVQGAYRTGRVRSRVDDFFTVLVGSVIAVVLGIAGTLYYQTYYVPPVLKAQGAYEVSQLVWALFLTLSVALSYAPRATVRAVREHRWRNGVGLKRILIAGTSDVARHVVDKMLQHGELGYRIVGFVDDRAGGDHLGYRGLPLLGTLSEVD